MLGATLRLGRATLSGQSGYLIVSQSPAKPVLIIQHTEVAEPGQAIPILNSLGFRTHLVRVFAGESIPRDSSPFSGVASFGGSMSALDEHPWMADEIELMRDADRRDIPIAGHCLGAQLAAIAFGGSVAKSKRMEIGWTSIAIEDSSAAREWCGAEAGKPVRLFQWHGQDFVSPTGAERIAVGKNSPEQIVVLRNRHLLFQPHLEVTPDDIRRVVKKDAEEVAEEKSVGNPAVNGFVELLADLDTRTSAMHGLLRCLYTRLLRRG